MTAFDLLFLALFAVTVATLLGAAIAFLKGNRTRSRHIARRWAVCALVYLAVVYAVAIGRPRRILSVGQDHCFDEWCVIVDGASRTPEGHRVNFHLFNRARRADQHANGVEVYLTDDRGRRWDPEPDPTGVPMNTVLHAGESKAAALRFRTPPNVQGLGFVVNHGMGLPVCLVIGDEQCLFHTRPVVRLP